MKRIEIVASDDHLAEINRKARLAIEQLAVALRPVVEMIKRVFEPLFLLAQGPSPLAAAIARKLSRGAYRGARKRQNALRRMARAMRDGTGS